MTEHMTHTEFKAALADLGYSQEGFAVLVGYSKRTGQKWALNETRIPGAVAILMRLMLARPEIKPVIEDLGHIPTLARAD
jgi:DNA-binding transcriptional regulator YiaG